MTTAARSRGAAATGSRVLSGLRRGFARSLEVRLVAGSIVVAVLVAGGIAVLVLAVSSLRDATDREAETKDRTVAALQLEKLVLDMETATRGFAITLQPKFLDPLRSARQELPDRVERFQRRFATSVERPRAEEIVREINSYVSDYIGPIVRLARIDPGAARTDVAQHEDQTRLRAIRARFSTLLAVESDTAARAAAAARRTSTRATALALGAAGASALLIVLFGVFLARSIARPLRGAAEGANRVAGGDLAVRLEETGPGEVGELTHAFNQMTERLGTSRAELEEQNVRLRESERLKSELISIVSHELRTPLASILGFSTLLLKRDIDEVDRRHYLEIVDAQGRRLAGLVNDFLDAQRIEEGRFELNLETIDVADVLREQTQLFAGESERHALHLHLAHEPLPVRADRNRLTQVIANLLSNAIKYSPGGGTVAIAARQDEDFVHVSVRDEGVGIPRDEHARIFTRFFRGTARESGIAGTGLGLALARDIIEAHGGRIDFTSDPGAGSTFWFELPALHASGRE